MSIAPAPIDRAVIRERVVKAAVEWVTDQSCSSALAELEDAVGEFTAGADERLHRKLSRATPATRTALSRTEETPDAQG